MEMQIDLVYLWVDGNDPDWQNKRQLFMKYPINTIGRYQDNQELKYSLRSIEKHLPWIRKIFIVTDDQVPSFIDTSHPKIEIIHHADIIPKEILPIFNSVIIEYFIYKIPDLSEHFLYANDDMFVNKDLSPSFFFKDGLPIVRMINDPFLKSENWLKKILKMKVNNFRLSIENAYRLFERRYGLFYSVAPHHNIDAYLKSDIKAVVEDVFEKELEAIFLNRFRKDTDIQRILLHYYAIAQKRGHLKYVGRRESCRIRVQKKDYQKFITKYQPQLFCLNDTEHATDKDRERIQPFLENLFPAKSSFEK